MFKRVNKQRAKRERKEQLNEAEDYLGINEIDTDDSSSSSGSDSEEGSEQSPQDESFVSVAEALNAPIFSSELDEDTKSCYICPRVLLKHDKMAEVHLDSNTHKRRAKRIQTVMSSMDTEELEILDIQSMVEAIDSERPNFATSGPSDGKSNRAKKREKSVTQKRERAAQRKAKRRSERDAGTNKDKDMRSSEAKVRSLSPDVTPKPKPAKKPRLGST